MKAYNIEVINRFHQRKVHNAAVVEKPQDDPPEPPAPDNGSSDLPESDLDIPDDLILDFVNSQCHKTLRIWIRISPRNLRLVIFLGKLNNLDNEELILEMHTWKHSLMKSCTLLLAQGYILIFLKVLCGLNSSGKR